LNNRRTSLNLVSSVFFDFPSKAVTSSHGMLPAIVIIQLLQRPGEAV